MNSIIRQPKTLSNSFASSVMQDTPPFGQKWLINLPTHNNCYIGTNYNCPWPHTLTHNASIACGYLIASHNHSWLITITNTIFPISSHKLIWWTQWHQYFFIMYVFNKHQNDQWLLYHCARFLNIGLNTKVYLMILKYVTDYWLDIPTFSFIQHVIMWQTLSD